MEKIWFEWCEYGHHHVSTRNRNSFIRSFKNMYDVDSHRKKSVEADSLLKIMTNVNLERIIIDKDSNKALDIPTLTYVIHGQSHEFSLDRNNIFIWMYLNSICLNIRQALKHNDHELVGILFPRNTPHNF